MTNERNAYNWEHSDWAMGIGFGIFIVTVLISVALMLFGNLDWVPRLWALGFMVFLVCAVISYAIFMKENPSDEEDME